MKKRLYTVVIVIVFYMMGFAQADSASYEFQKGANSEQNIIQLSPIEVISYPRVH